MKLYNHKSLWREIYHVKKILAPLKQNTSNQYGGHEDKYSNHDKKLSGCDLLEAVQTLRFTIRVGPFLARQPIVRQRTGNITTPLEREDINIFEIVDLLSHICLNVRA